jgi:deazaflavin-dependent oxidoreductase (nitroreductase family)
MPVDGDYEPSTQAWVRDQVEAYESSGGTQGTTLRDTGLPVVIITNRGASSGKVRKTPVMRVEHDGSYAAVASRGGAPEHPQWYYNLRDNPRVELQDGQNRWDMTAREITGDERAEWWDRAVAAYPPYAEYQQRTTRQIPVLRPIGTSMRRWVRRGRRLRACSGGSSRLSRAQAGSVPSPGSTPAGPARPGSRT